MISRPNRKTSTFIAGYFGLIIALGCMAYFTDGYLGLNKLHKVGPDVRFVSDVGYVDLPRMNLTLASGEGHTGRLSLDLSIEVEKKNAGRLQNYQPILSDRLISYTRALDIDELRKPQNQHVFRTELLEEAKSLSMPVPIVDVVIRRMVIL
jgi:flagellar basal body-associated protein FliL